MGRESVHRNSGGAVAPKVNSRSQGAKKRSKKSGLPPGTLVHIGRQLTDRVSISVMEYDEAHFTEQTVGRVDELVPFLERPTTTWITVEGLHQVDIIEAIGERLNLHPLVREDIVNTTQRPKMEDLDDYLFLVFRTLQYDDETSRLGSEQISLILGTNIVVCFMETANPLFDAIKERIRTAKGRTRKAGADYLAYCLLDAVVDNYFDILEKLGERVESAEEELVTNPTRQTLQTIHTFKTDLIFLRRAVWPLREVLNRTMNADSRLIEESTVPYLRDVYDHTIHAIDTLETFRDIVSGMLDIYLSSVSNRLNETMKVLTIIATIFIPLTFLSGWYGMNFKTMPELEWRYGYVMVICVALSMATAMLIFFRRKGWI
jgi:magnesium transporter